MSTPREDIAIVGMACRFPGGCDNPSKLWDLLRNPRDLLRKISNDRFDSKAYYHPDPNHHGTTNVQESYFLDEDPALFDNSFFNIQPSEGEAIDPQQRMLLETVYDSLCAAGLPMESLRGTPTAVYVGMMCDDWSGILSRDWEAFPTYSATGMGRSIMSNRISYCFDWHGPSMTIDTACSSSLVAVHQAAQTLLSGQSRVAIAAGANLILSPAMYIAESKLHMLSPTGRSRMWDESADGYARGECIAAVVLKTLSAALEDGDDIKCIIRGTGVNQDGRTPGLTMPSATAQAELIRDTYAGAGLNIDAAEDRPQFFHAHGTGTQAGDPQEAESISRAFFNGNHAEDQSTLYVGSLKTIIGHTEGTAGLASLIGTCLAVQHGVIPPNMHFNRLSPKVAPFYHHLEIPTVAKKWPSLTSGQVRRASVNSFGFGGTNAHAIIEAYEPEHSDTEIVPTFTPFTFSAASERSLRSMLTDHSDFLKTHPDVNLRDLSWTLQTRRSTLSYRKSIVGGSSQDLHEKIDSLLNDNDGTDAGLDTRYYDSTTPRILGVFTGQGAQWARMGAELIETSPFVASKIAELDATLANLPLDDRPSWTIKEQLLADSSTSRVLEAAISQPLCTAIQVVLVDLLKLAGIKFHAVVGHSSGEIGAAYAAGLITARDAVCIAYYRGLYAKLANSPNGAKKGAMLAVGTSLEDATNFCELETFAGRIQVAACNSSSSVTLSGDEDAIADAAEIFKDEQKFARILNVDTAYHSSHMKQCEKPYLESISKCGIESSDGQGPTWYSSVVDGLIMTNETLQPHYWVQNMSNAVLFSTAVATATEHSGPFDMALEVGPHPALQGPCLSNLEEASGNRIPYSGLLSRYKNDIDMLSAALASVWTQLGSASVDFETFETAVSGCVQTKKLVKNLPTYPFDHKRSFWAMSRQAGSHATDHAVPHPILGRRCLERDTAQEVQWRNFLMPKEIGWLKGHKLQGQIVFPATGYVAMAIEAMNILAGERESGVFTITDLTIGRAIAFNDDSSSVEILFSVKLLNSGDDELVAEFACYSTVSQDSSMSLNASGRVLVSLQEAAADCLPLVPGDQFNLVDVEIDRFYGALTRLGYGYSGPFSCITQIKRKIDYAVGTIKERSGLDWEDQLVVHPGLLDTALQTLFAAYCSPGDERLWSLHVPTHIDSITVNPRYTTQGSDKESVMPYQAFLRSSRRNNTSGDVHLYTKDKTKAIVQFEGVHLVPFSAALPENDAVLFSRFEYRLAHPNGDIAAAGDGPTPEELDMAVESDRISYFYLRRLVETITPEEKNNTLPHYQRLLEWAKHVVGLVARGEHLAVPPKCDLDTHEQIVEIINRYRDRVDVRLLESVGENLPDCIRSSSNILEHMTKDGILDQFYEIGLGLDNANRWIARMANQVAHRYPHMRILEIGAGTGGSTRAVLPALGSTFSSYTYTDISSAFFETAQERFKDYASRMIFKTFDMERTPASQGFDEGSYDMVLASNVLHATNKLENMMTHVRQFLKPGGYAIIFEITSNDLLRVGLPMGGLTGWWTGAESGRPWGPAMSLIQWDSLLRRCGFAGIETATPPFHELHPCSVFAAQAVDDRINLLRDPLSLLSTIPATETSNLILVGGKTLQVHRTTTRITSLLEPRFVNITRAISIEDLCALEVPTGSTVLCLAELDEPLLRTVTLGKLNGLKTLWGQARNILWVTRGSRAEEPHSFMMIGIGRAMRSEYPNINLQMLDIDCLGNETAQILAETVLRLELLDTWQKTATMDNLMWSSEPEVVLENGLVHVPRLYKHQAANDRYNTARRTILKHANPQESTIVLAGLETFFELQDVSPLRIQANVPEPTEIRSVRISHSVLPLINVEAAGFMMLCVGVDVATNERLLALSRAAESPAPTRSEWTIPIPYGDPVVSLHSVAAHITASHIASLVQPGGVLLVHEPDVIFKEALASLAARTNLNISFTTSLKANAGTDWIYVERNLPKALLKEVIPLASVFIDLSQAENSAEAGKLIGTCMLQDCISADANFFFGTTTDPRQDYSVEHVAAMLKTAWAESEASELDHSSDQSSTIIALNDISNHAVIGGPLAIVDWSAPSVSVAVQAIDEGDIFKADKTYLLIGLSGEVGQSLCQWMVNHGARHVVLTSRRPAVNPDYLLSLENMGATVKALPLDVTNRDSLQACCAEIARTMPPIAGVANGAMVLHDTMFENMTPELMTGVLQPKVAGSKLLDEMFYNTPLDFFILFSSLTAVVGNSGQSNYIAANMYMTALSAQRKKRGVAGSTIDISSLMGIGYVERSEDFDADYFTKIGYVNISEQDLHQLFAEAIVVGHPDSAESAELATGLTPIYADKDVKAQYRTDQKFVHFVLERPETEGEAHKTSSIPVRVLLLEAKDKKQVYSIINDSFVARLKRTLQIPAEESINERASLVEQGVDSLMAVEVRSWFIKELDIDMPVLKVLGGSSIDTLLEDAMERLPTSIIDLVALEGGTSTQNTSSKPAVVPGATKIESTEAAVIQDSSDNNSLSPSTSCTTPPSTDTDEAESKSLSDVKRDTPQELGREDLFVKASTEATEKMSYGQTRFWFLNHYLKDQKAFNMAVMFRLTGPIRTSAMERAVQTVVRRHEALRTRFFWSDDGQNTPMQGILPHPLVHLETKQIVTEAEAHAELGAMHDHAWDLQDWESMKIRILSISDNVHYVVVGCHHIVLDGYSFSVFFVDLEAAYTNKPLAPLPAESQYRAFAAQQHRDYANGNMNKAIKFYRELLPEKLQPIPLFPFAKVNSRKTLTHYSLHLAEAKVEPALTLRIKQLARKCRSTTFHVYLATLQALMFRLLPEASEFFIGIADANRMDKKYIGSLGFFLNLLPLRFDRSKAGAKFSEAVQAARNKAYGALEHSVLPFDLLLNELNITRSSSHTPIFQAFVDYRQVHQERGKFGECETGGEQWRNARTGYDISLEITENPKGEALLALRLQDELYSKDSTALLLRSYVKLLDGFCKSTDVAWNSPPLWTTRDINQALEVGKGSTMKLEWPDTISHKIDFMIEVYPSNIALKDGHGKIMTYAQMGARVNAIASRLVDAATKDGQVVAVFQEPSADWICSMLAAFRVGATYLPLDLRNSLARLSSAVRVVRPAFILTDNTTSSMVQSIEAGDAMATNVSMIEDVVTGPLSRNKAKSDSPAVVLFTSGTSGEPKGIVMSHANLRAQSEAYSRSWEIPEGAAKVLQQSPFSFDFSLDQIFAALANGGALYVVPASKRGDPEEITKLMIEERITYTSATPSEYAMWFQFAAANLSCCRAWRYAFAGGEALGLELIRQFRNLKLSGLRLFNNYGPAEITIASTKGEVQYNDADLENPVPAGYMLPNYTVYIVDDDLKPVPIGVSGEIVIGGPGVAVGYLGQDDLTKQSFLPNTLDSSVLETSSNVYRTGDRGRLREDGVVYCEGRIGGDTQIKLRGFRIELTEIEKAIIKTADGALSNAVVSLRGTSDSQFLVAHVVFSHHCPVQDQAQVLKTLRTKLPLPPYMCPSIVLPQASLPLTSHLKVDRRAVDDLSLPEMNGDIVSKELTNAENQLCSLWQQIIPHMPSITADSDFFHVGGHSLLLIKLQALIKQTFHAAPRLIDLMNASKLKEMATIIEAANLSSTLDWDNESALSPGLQATSTTLTSTSSTLPFSSRNGLTIILTGASGYLGRHIIARLVKDPKVTAIHCIVRDLSSISPALPSSDKITIHNSDISHPNLGLSDPDFTNLSATTDVILHCGANRSFWDNYEVLRAVNVNAVKELVRLALPRRVPVHFLSSGAVGMYDGGVPPIDGTDGYVASKWAAEKFLLKAAEEFGLPVRIHRPHACTTDQSAPADDAAALSVLQELMDIAKRLGIRPSFQNVRGHVDVTPVSKVVDAICGVLFSDSADTCSGDGEKVRIIQHEGELRVGTDGFREKLEADEEIRGLESMQALEWFGEAKRAGFEWFMVAQELVMGETGKGEVVSRR